MRYCYADVGRVGLANMLLPWARCEVFGHEHGLRMLAPQWTQPKIGPLLRGEKDKRYYVGLFKNAGYIRGLRRWWILATASRIQEPLPPSDASDKSDRSDMSDSSDQPSPGPASLAVFRGLGRYFKDLAGHEDFLHQRLKDILSADCARRLESARKGPFIAVHIRRGDKPPLPLGAEPPADSMHWAIPTEWYVVCITQVQAALGGGLPVVVFTDAFPEQIAAVLNLPGVALAEKNPSIVDMLLMAEARALITTSSSTFSMWPSFLGRMPSVWFPARWREQTNFARPEMECYTDSSGNLSSVLQGLVGQT